MACFFISFSVLVFHSFVCPKPLDQRTKHQNVLLKNKNIRGACSVKYMAYDSAKIN